MDLSLYKYLLWLFSLNHSVLAILRPYAVFNLTIGLSACSVLFFTKFLGYSKKEGMASTVLTLIFGFC